MQRENAIDPQPALLDVADEAHRERVGEHRASDMPATRLIPAHGQTPTVFSFRPGAVRGADLAHEPPTDQLGEPGARGAWGQVDRLGDLAREPPLAASQTGEDGPAGPSPW